MIGIYKIENLINGKKYIGQSVDVHARLLDHKRVNERPLSTVQHKYPLYRALKKYGLENFSYELIEECKKEELDDKEIYWIAYYHTYINDPQCNGYNLTMGGAGNRQITQEEIDNFIELWEQGLSVGEIAILTERTNHPIIKYLKLYCSSYNIEEGDKRGRVLGGIKHRKAIIQYDFLGRKEKEYESIKQAERELGYKANSIIQCLKLRQKGCNKKYFIYKDEDQEEYLKQLINMSNNTFKPVIQLDLEGNIINCFPTSKDAFQQTGVPSASISACCNGRAKTGHGYKWEYLNYDNLIEYNLKELMTEFERSNQ